MAHIHELIDFTVGAIIVSPDRTKVLLINHPIYGKWLCPGGHIELDEDPDQALIREIKEETGLEVDVMSERADAVGKNFKVLYRPRFVDIHYANAPHRHIGLTYFCVAKTEDVVLSDEHDEIAWFSLQELDKIKAESDEMVIFYSKKALEELANG